jgi:hypothetical protein
LTESWFGRKPTWPRLIWPQNGRKFYKNWLNKHKYNFITKNNTKNTFYCVFYINYGSTIYVVYIKPITNIRDLIKNKFLGLLRLAEEWLAENLNWSKSRLAKTRLTESSNWPKTSQLKVFSVSNTPCIWYSITVLFTLKVWKMEDFTLDNRKGLKSYWNNIIAQKTVVQALHRTLVHKNKGLTRLANNILYEIVQNIKN